MSITIYSKSGCPECVFTKKFLESKNVPYVEKRVDLNKTYLNEVTDLGYSSLPVIKTDKNNSFNGYNPEKLEILVSEWQN